MFLLSRTCIARHCISNSPIAKYNPHFFVFFIMFVSSLDVNCTSPQVVTILPVDTPAPCCLHRSF